MTTDHELLQYKAIFDAHGAMVYSTCRRILGDSDQAEDAVQDTFLYWWTCREKIKGSLAAWLHRVAYGKAVDRVRRETTRRHHEAQAKRNRSAHADSPTDLAQSIDAAINTLPDESRYLLIAHFLDQVPQADLATELGCSPATVSRRLQTAVGLLRHALTRGGLVVPLALLNTALAAATQQLPAALARRSGYAMLGMVSTPAASGLGSGAVVGMGLVATLLVSGIVALFTWHTESMPAAEATQQMVNQATLPTDDNAVEGDHDVVETVPSAWKPGSYQAILLEPQSSANGVFHPLGISDRQTQFGYVQKNDDERAAFLQGDELNVLPVDAGTRILAQAGSSFLIRQEDKQRPWAKGHRLVWHNGQAWPVPIQFIADRVATDGTVGAWGTGQLWTPGQTIRKTNLPAAKQKQARVVHLSQDGKAYCGHYGSTAFLEYAAKLYSITLRNKETWATAINNRGWTVGYMNTKESQAPHRSRPFLFTPESGLVHLADAAFQPIGINKHGMVLGAGPSKLTVFIWHPLTGQRTLRELLGKEQDWQIRNVHMLTDDGCILLTVRTAKGSQLLCLQPEQIPDPDASQAAAPEVRTPEHAAERFVIGKRPRAVKQQTRPQDRPQGEANDF